mgnify:CR=1 FL=1
MILVKKKEGRRTEETRKKNKKEERKERVFLQQTLVVNSQEINIVLLVITFGCFDLKIIIPCSMLSSRLVNISVFLLFLMIGYTSHFVLFEFQVLILFLINGF